MNYLSVENLTKSFGDRIIFKNLTFGVDKGDKVAIVAKNGQGKTTLLNILCGDGTEDDGRIVFRNGLRVDYLQQREAFDTDKTILEEVLDADTPETEAIKAYQKALKNIDDQEAFDKAQEQMNRLNAWDYEVKIKTVLSELKFEDHEQVMGNLSGGQRRRVALAKVLINEPDVMILDEPTNHLDLDMIEWLETFLSNTQSTIIMVTHDRYFLEVICNTIFELSDQTIYKYTGNYSYYLEKKAEREEILQATIGKAKNLMRKELDWIRRQPKARGTKQKARVDAFKDLKKVATQKMQKDELEIRIQMNRLGSKIVELHKIGKAYGDIKIINDFSYVFKKGEKLGIVGPNGSGKSTLLNMLTGSETPDKGKIVVGDTVIMGYYHQDGLKFKPEKRVIEVIKDIAEFIPLMKGKKLSAAQFLEMFLFPKDMHFNYVEKLSGGEQKRLYLMTILMKNPNFLILDEPTNDLDIFTLGVLEDYLESFDGCLIIVSHDRYFLDKLVDHTFYFKGDGEIKDIIGNYTAYRQFLSEERSAEKQLKKAVSESKEKDRDTKKKKLSYKEKLEFESLEGEIADLESERNELMEKMNAGTEDSETVNKIAIRLGEIGMLIEEKEMRWLELSEYV